LKEVGNVYRNLGDTLKGKSKDSITKEELLMVVKWKFLVGKPRHALIKHLEANSEASVMEQSAKAIGEARSITDKTDPTVKDEQIKAAIEALTDLKGVGPATASAVLSLVVPGAFCYMYDEVIETFLPKRNYTLLTYLSTNKHCAEVACRLGKGWTPCRVAQVLWTAARADAYGLCDHTQDFKNNGKDRTADKSKERIPNKRRRKS
jgi:hypothetical protein